MLKHTFCHLDSVGEKIEYNLWSSGIKTWNDFLEYEFDDSNLSKFSGTYFKTEIEKSIDKYNKTDLFYFYKSLTSRNHWRLYGDFRDEAAFLDIETTGLSKYRDIITTISVLDKDGVKVYVNGKNLNQFAQDVKNYSLIVSFNGKRFDVPFIESFFQTRINAAHIDLCLLLGSMGYKGGLKVCEKCFGIDRGNLEGVDGYFAVLLWKSFKQSRDERFLDTLIAYNVEDVLNLKVLMDRVYNQKIIKTPFSDEVVSEDVLENPYQPDLEVIDQIRFRR